MCVVRLTGPFIYLTRVVPRLFTPQVVDLCKRSPVSYAAEVFVFECFNLRSWKGTHTSSAKSLFVVYTNSVFKFSLQGL